MIAEETPKEWVVQAGQRAVKAKAWTWSCGMRDVDGRRILAVDPSGTKFVIVRESDGVILDGGPSLPDFSDAGTAGLLKDKLSKLFARDAAKDHAILWSHIYTLRDDHGNWDVWERRRYVAVMGRGTSDLRSSWGSCPTEVDALISALVGFS